ncbi:MAG: hypothetical protein AAGB22_08675, partial [Bacteroidota bacterium]
MHTFATARVWMIALVTLAALHAGVSSSYAQCLPLNNQSVTLTPQATVNGGVAFYPPNTTVTMCLDVTQYNGCGANWLDGIAPIFGPGWDTSTLAPSGTVATAGLSAGTWIWTSGFTSTNTNMVLANPGWYFDLNNDGNPGNDFGDGGSNQGPWTFCWSIATKSIPPGIPGSSLSFQIENYSDAEAGSWGNLCCSGGVD